MRSVQFGSTGPGVQLLQLALDRAGFGPLQTDGIFGPATRGAVSRFQAVNRLAVDGIAGPATHRALLPWYTGYVTVRIRRGHPPGKPRPAAGKPARGRGPDRAAALCRGA